MPYRVSIVTPTYRMGRFLPQAIESVLEQGVEVEYLVLDAASGDGSTEILAGYEGRLTWRSERDRGASDALRRGLGEVKGEILGWLNADDLLLPGAIHAVLAAFESHPEAVAVFSGARWVSEDLTPLGSYPVSAGAVELLPRECLICQPACFFRADAYAQCGGVDPALQSAFDYDLWIRMARLGPFVHIPGEWALSRMHRENKTIRERDVMFRENRWLLKKHYGYVPFRWIYSDMLFRSDGRDQFFDDFEPSVIAYLLSLPAGLAQNPLNAGRYLREWSSQFSWNGLKRWFSAWERP